MTKEKTLKNLRPTKIDANLEYRCPACSLTHWLSLRETQTKGFKVVCSCDTVFGVKTIEKIKVKYKTKTKAIEKNSAKETDDLVDRCLKEMEAYGFERKEMESTVKRVIEDTKSKNIVDIIKTCILNCGVTNG